MEIQTIINIVFAVAFIGYVVWQRNPTFDTIICKEWRVVDKDGKMRIMATTLADGDASMSWLDNDGKMRINAATSSDGQAAMQWLDKEGNMKIAALTTAKGIPAVMMYDNMQVRIAATILSSGTVRLPTEDLNLPKKP